MFIFVVCMCGAGVEAERAVVFDVSLLSPHSLELVRVLLEEGNLTFVATPTMLKIIKELDKYRGLLRLWNIDTRNAELILKILHDLKFFEKVKIVAVEDLREKEYLGPLMELIREKEIAPGIEGFLVEEMCLAVAGYPILCTSASKWKIVEFFERIGAKVKRVVHMRVREKGEVLRTEKFRNMVLAMGLSAAFVYVFAGPLAAFTELGATAITLIVVDG
jgi:hypothetical protein